LKSAVRSDTVDQIIAQYQEVPVLLIDDLGTEQLNTYSGQSEFVLSGLQDIMEYRYVYAKPTMVTSNLTLTELDERYQRISSRLQEGTVHTVQVRDYRRR